MTSFRKKHITKILSIVLLHTFIFSNIGFATIDEPASYAEAKEISLDEIGISKEIGSIKGKHKGKDEKLIIHIQDAHCNYEAQTNIAKILEHLIKDYNINFVAVEGADGVVDTTWFKAFPDAEIRKEVADYFMKKGEITGAEFLSITSDYPFTIYGAEDRKYYIKNLNSFLESYPYKDEFQKYYQNIKSALFKLKRFIYTKELIEIDSKIDQHKEKEIEFADYTRYLNEISKSKKIDIDEYENFKILVETLRYEKDINFDIVNEERATLIDELSKKLSKDKISELVNKSLAFKLGKIDNNEFYAYLAELSKENSISLAGKYNNLARYIVYSRIYSKIDNEKLFDEIDLLVRALKEKMFVNEDQRRLDRLWTNVNIVLGFMDIELTNKEYEYYLANKDEFAPDKFTGFIQQNSSRFGLAYEIDESPRELTYIFPKLVDFYEIATKRDEILIKNMFKGMQGKKADAAVLITGGFHTKGIEKLLEKEDVSYVVISPAITKEVESPYVSVLTGQKTPFEELLTKTAKEDALLAPYLIARAVQLRKRELVELNRLIKTIDERGLLERVEDFKIDWTTMHMSRWIAEAEKFARESNLPADKNVLFRAYLLSVDHAIKKWPIAKKHKESVEKVAKVAIDRIYEARQTKSFPAGKEERIEVDTANSYSDEEHIREAQVTEQVHLEKNLVDFHNELRTSVNKRERDFIGHESENDIRKLTEIADLWVKNNDEHIIFVGEAIDASVPFLLQALTKRDDWNVHARREGRPQVHFIDSYDSRSAADILRKIDSATSGKVRIVPVGISTEETEKFIGELQENTAVNVETENTHIFTGNTTGLLAAGLVLDTSIIKAVYDGAKDSYDKWLELPADDISEYAAYRLASTEVRMAKTGQNISVFMMFSMALRNYSVYLAQLYNREVGSADLPVWFTGENLVYLHSTQQAHKQAVDFPRNETIRERVKKGFISLVFLNPQQKGDVASTGPSHPMLRGLGMRFLVRITRAAYQLSMKLARRPIIEVNFDAENPADLGRLLHFAQISAAMAGRLADSKPENNPIADLEKRIAKNLKRTTKGEIHPDGTLEREQNILGFTKKGDEVSFNGILGDAIERENGKIKKDSLIFDFLSILKILQEKLNSKVVKAYQSGTELDHLNPQRIEEEAVAAAGMAKLFKDKKRIYAVSVGGSTTGPIMIDVLGLTGGPEIVEVQSYDADLMGRIKEDITSSANPEDIGIVIISKSGVTTEVDVNGWTLVETLGEALTKKTKDKNAIYNNVLIVTDPQVGTLRKKVGSEGWRMLLHPVLIGGRWSMFSGVGLFYYFLKGGEMKELLNAIEQMKIKQSGEEAGRDWDKVLKGALEEIKKYKEQLDPDSKKNVEWGERKKAVREIALMLSQIPGVWEGVLDNMVNTLMKVDHDRDTEVAIALQKPYERLISHKGPFWPQLRVESKSKPGVRFYAAAVWGWNAVRKAWNRIISNRRNYITLFGETSSSDKAGSYSARLEQARWDALKKELDENGVPFMSVRTGPMNTTNLLQIMQFQYRRLAVDMALYDPMDHKSEGQPGVEDTKNIVRAVLTLVAEKLSDKAREAAETGTAADINELKKEGITIPETPPDQIEHLTEVSINLPETFVMDDDPELVGLIMQVIRGDGDNPGLLTRHTLNEIKNLTNSQIHGFLRELLLGNFFRIPDVNRIYLDGQQLDANGKRWIIRATSIENHSNIEHGTANGTNMGIYEYIDGKLTLRISIQVLWGSSVRATISNGSKTQDYKLKGDGQRIVEVDRAGEDNSIIMSQKGNYISIGGLSKERPEGFQMFESKISVPSLNTSIRFSDSLSADAALMMNKQGLLAEWMTLPEAFELSQIMGAASGFTMFMTEEGLKHARDIEISEKVLSDNKQIYVYAGNPDSVRQIKVFVDYLNVDRPEATHGATSVPVALDILRTLRDIPQNASSVLKAQAVMWALSLKEGIDVLPPATGLRGDIKTAVMQISSELEKTLKKLNVDETIKKLRDEYVKLSIHAREARANEFMLLGHSRAGMYYDPEIEAGKAIILVYELHDQFERASTWDLLSRLHDIAERDGHPAIARDISESMDYLGTNYKKSAKTREKPQERPLQKTFFGESFGRYLDDSVGVPEDVRRALDLPDRKLPENAREAMNRVVDIYLNDQELGTDESLGDLLEKLRDEEEIFYKKNGKRYVRSLHWIRQNIDERKTGATVNQTGDVSSRLDHIYNHILIYFMRSLVSTIISEEETEQVRGHQEVGVDKPQLVAFIDPIDGSSQVKEAGTFGMIFTVGILLPGQRLNEFDARKQILASFDIQFGWPRTILNVVNRSNINAGVSTEIQNRPELIQFELTEGESGEGESFRKQLRYENLSLMEDGLVWNGLIPLEQATKGLGVAMGGSFVDSRSNDGHREIVRWLEEHYGYRLAYTGALVNDIRKLLKQFPESTAGVLHTYGPTGKHVEGRFRLAFELYHYSLMFEVLGGEVVDGIEPMLNHRLIGTKPSGITKPFYGANRWITKLIMAWRNYVRTNLEETNPSQDKMANEFKQFITDYETKSKRLIGDIVAYSESAGEHVARMTEEEARRLLLEQDGDISGLLNLSIEKDGKNYFAEIAKLIGHSGTKSFPAGTTTVASEKTKIRNRLRSSIPIYEGSTLYNNSRVDITPGVSPEAVKLAELVQRALLEAGKIVPKRGPPISIHLLPSVPPNVQKLIDPSGKIHLLLDKKYIETLLTHQKDYPNAIRWILAERLAHELSHDNKMGTQEEERLEEIDVIIKTDLRFYRMLLGQPELRREVDRFFDETGVKFGGRRFYKVLLAEIAGKSETEALDAVKKFVDRYYDFGLKSFPAEVEKEVKGQPLYEDLKEIFDEDEALLSRYINSAREAMGLEDNIESRIKVVSGMFSPETSKAAIDELIEQIKRRRPPKDKKSVLVFGGGTAIAASIKPIAKLGAYARSVQTSIDDGGSTFKMVMGLIARGYGWMPSPGDLGNSLFTGLASSDKMYKLLDAQGRIKLSKDGKILYIKAVEKDLSTGKKVTIKEEVDNFYELTKKLLNRIVTQTAVTREGVGHTEKTTHLSDDFVFFAASVLNIAKLIDTKYFDSGIISKDGASIRNLVLLGAMDYLGIINVKKSPYKDEEEEEGRRQFMLKGKTHKETRELQEKFQGTLDLMAEFAGIRNGRVSLSHQNPVTVYAIHRDNIIMVDEKPGRRTADGKKWEIEPILHTLVVKVEKDKGKITKITVGYKSPKSPELNKTVVLNSANPKQIINIGTIGDLKITLKMDKKGDFSFNVNNSLYATLVEPKGGIEKTYVEYDDEKHRIATDGTGMVRFDTGKPNVYSYGPLDMAGKMAYVRSRFTAMQTHITETPNYSKVEEFGFVDEKVEYETVRVEKGGKIEEEPETRGIYKPKPARRVEANEEIIDAIKNPDTKSIIFGPGSYLTSLMPHFLVGGLTEALVERRRKGDIPIILVINPNIDNETAEFDVPHFLEFIEGQIEKRVGHKIKIDSMFTDLVINKFDTVKINEYCETHNLGRPESAIDYVDMVSRKPELIDELGLTYFNYLINKYMDVTSKPLLALSDKYRFAMTNDDGEPITVGGKKEITVAEYLEFKIDEFLKTLFQQPTPEIRTDPGQASNEAKKSRGPLYYTQDDIDAISKDNPRLYIHYDLFLAGVGFLESRDPLELAEPHIGFLDDYTSYILGEIIGLTTLRMELTQAYKKAYQKLPKGIRDQVGNEKTEEAQRLIFGKYRPYLIRELEPEARTYFHQLSLEGFIRALNWAEIKRQIEKSETIFNRVLEKLKANDVEEEIIEATKHLYSFATRRSRRPFRENPMHHSLGVFEFMVDIALGERASPEELKRAIAIALFHDIGTRTRTRKADMHTEEDFRKAIKERTENAKRGSEDATKLMEQINRQYGKKGKPIFTPEDIEIVRKVILIHNNPSIQAYEEVNTGQWLLPKVAPKVAGEEDTKENKIARLAMFQREADRLWMLSEDGIEFDLEKDEEAGVERNLQERIEWNIRRHQEEYELYAKAFGENVGEYGFIKKTLYRTRTGFNISQRLIIAGFEESVRRTAELLGIEESDVQRAISDNINRDTLLGDFAESVGIKMKKEKEEDPNGALENMITAGIAEKTKDGYGLTENFFKNEKLREFMGIQIVSSFNPEMVDLTFLRIERIILNSIDVNDFIAQLAKSAGKSPEVVIATLKEADIFPTIVATWELTRAEELSTQAQETVALDLRNFVNPESTRFYEDSGVGVEFSLPADTEVDLGILKMLQEYQEVMARDMARGEYNYRGTGTRETVRQFFNDYFIPTWYNKIREHIKKLFDDRGEPLKAIVTNGIGANDQFMWALVRMYNENRPNDAPKWYHMGMARDLVKLKADGIEGKNALFMDISRSGKTWEGVEVGIRSLDMGFTKRIAIANGEAVEAISKAAAKKSGYEPLIIGMSPDIGGRNMHRKTTIYYTAQTIAGMFLPSMDSKVFAELHHKFDEANDFATPEKNVAVSAGRFLHGSMRLLGVEHIVFITNTEPLRLIGTEWEQYIMEGSNKADIISMGIHDLPNEPGYVLTNFAKGPGGSMSLAMALLDKSAPTYQEDLARVNALKNTMPVIIFTIGSEKAKEEGFERGISPKQQAAFDILWTDLVTVFTTLLRVDANSNPNVKKVRAYTTERVEAWRNAQASYEEDLIGKGEAGLLISYGMPEQFGDTGIGSEGTQEALTRENATEKGRELARELAQKGALKDRNRLNLFVGRDDLMALVRELRKDAYKTDLATRHGWITQTALFPLWSHKGLEANLANRNEAKTPGALLADRTVNIFFNARRLGTDTLFEHEFDNQGIIPKKYQGINGATINQTNDAMTIPNIKRMAEVSPTILFEFNDVTEDVKETIKAFYEAFIDQLVKELPAPISVQGVKPFPAGEEEKDLTLALRKKLEKEVETEKEELRKTLAMSMYQARPEDGVVIIALDDNLYRGYANSVITQLPRAVGRNTKPNTVMIVRGKGRDLLNKIADARQKVEAQGMKVRKVVTQLNSKAPLDVKEALAKTGLVLDIDFQERDLNRYYTQIIRIFDLSFKIAYDFSAEDIGITLSRITGEDVSTTEVMEMLSRKILTVLPRMEPIDTGTAYEIYRAVKRALVSL